MILFINDDPSFGSKIRLISTFDFFLKIFSEFEVIFFLFDGGG